MRKILGAILLPPRPRVFSLSADLRDASSTNVFFSSLAAHQHDPRLHSTPCCFSSRYRGGKAIFPAASGQRKYPRSSFFEANSSLGSLDLLANRVTRLFIKTYHGVFEKSGNTRRMKIKRGKRKLIKIGKFSTVQGTATRLTNSS